jgi:hypothetical protein
MCKFYWFLDACGASRSLGGAFGRMACGHPAKRSMINYARWQSQADFNAFLKKHGAGFAQFGQNASRTDPHTYDVVCLDEPAGK